ncbi:MAG: hypothetical protein K6G87_12045 [Butyrivibrio sp.]|uniref:hypothetical protein n=1 Tax=Butyrivibrio sp. TaxID=28121 RepID=UPI0025FC86C7|nr:hypothetical protein [Butyrivibrio sp.]MCR5771942.1 hypothetical protein [Butyrivibrio sp.]
MSMRDNTGSKGPVTVDELNDYCRQMDINPYNSNFFIGSDHIGADAYGIYKDYWSGDFVVYRNEYDGTKVIKYQGPDEALAVETIYEYVQAYLKNPKNKDDDDLQRRLDEAKAQIQVSLDYKASLDYQASVNISKPEPAEITEADSKSENSGSAELSGTDSKSGKQESSYWSNAMNNFESQDNSEAKDDSDRKNNSDAKDDSVAKDYSDTKDYSVAKDYSDSLTYGKNEIDSENDKNNDESEFPPNVELSISDAVFGDIKNFKLNEEDLKAGLDQLDDKCKDAVDILSDYSDNFQEENRSIFRNLISDIVDAGTEYLNKTANEDNSQDDDDDIDFLDNLVKKTNSVNSDDINDSYGPKSTAYHFNETDDIDNSINILRGTTDDTGVIDNTIDAIKESAAEANVNKNSIDAFNGSSDKRDVIDNRIDASDGSSDKRYAIDNSIDALNGSSDEEDGTADNAADTHYDSSETHSSQRMSSSGVYNSYSVLSNGSSSRREYDYINDLLKGSTDEDAKRNKDYDLLHGSSTDFADDSMDFLNGSSNYYEKKDYIDEYDEDDSSDEYSIWGFPKLDDDSKNILKFFELLIVLILSIIILFSITSNKNHEYGGNGSYNSYHSHSISSDWYDY